MTIIFILAVAMNLCLLIDMTLAQSFDIFKSYKDAKIKPASYSKRRR